MQVVERRLEQAAEVVEPRLPAAGRSGTSGRDKSWMDLFRASLTIKTQRFFGLLELKGQAMAPLLMFDNAHIPHPVQL